MVPAVAFPPAVPFTDQVTLWFEEFATEAAKDCEAPARTFAEAGLTETETGFVGGALVCVPVVAHAIWNTSSKTNTGMRLRRKMSLR